MLIANRTRFRRVSTSLQMLVYDCCSWSMRHLLQFNVSFPYQKGTTSNNRIQGTVVLCVLQSVNRYNCAQRIYYLCKVKMHVYRYTNV